MQFYEKIDYIRDAQQDGRLVIFVGAGVSKNSNMPNWYELIKLFSKELPYGKCNNCENIDGCEECKCEFSTDEFLKIPQYYYNTCGSEKYFRFIKSVLDKECIPNPINEIIMDLQPKHIITTNYDRLIENTENVNSMLYKVVRKDDDLLKFQSNNYIIKMHGDIQEEDSIVLKEDDYLKYSFEHILIETMIKSLFLNHTFLFVGYSLNDYNLKLIISWVNEISKKYKISKERCKHFIIDIKKHEDYEIKYYEKSGIYVINDNDVTPEILNKYSENVDLENIIGKKLYSILNMIRDDNKNYEELNTESLYNNLQIFKRRGYISISELKSVYSKYITVSDVICNILIIRKKEEYDRLVKILNDNNDKISFIENIFYKAGIHKIMLIDRGKNETFDLNDKVDFNYELIELVQQNKFIEIYNKIINLNNSLEKVYYLHLCNPYDENIYEVLQILNKKVIDSGNYFELLLFKLNQRLQKIIIDHYIDKENNDFENIWSNIPNAQKKYYKYLKDIYSDTFDYNSYNKYIEDLEKNYRKEIDSGYYIGGSLYPVLKIQAFAYEYYYYIKLNHVMIDYFSNSKEIFGIYIKAMLCTYISSSKENYKDKFFRMRGKLLRYKLNKTDLDIIIKYIDSKTLKKYLKKYLINELEFEDDVDEEYIIDCFENLCSSLNNIYNEYFVEYIKNYLIIFTKCNLSDCFIERIVKSINYILNSKKFLYEELEDEIIIFMNYYRNSNISNINDFIDIILSKDILENVNIYRINKILKILSKNIDYEILQDKVINIINNSDDRSKYIFELSPIISKKNLDNFKDELIKNINIIRYDIIFNLIVDGIISYNKCIEDKYIELINKEIENKKKNPNLYTYPDKLEVLLEYVIIFHLLKFNIKIERFFEFYKHSIYIEFIRFKENFDYNKIHKLDYMWLNFFKNDYYRNLLITYGGQYIKHNLSVAIDEGYATEDEKKVYYKYFDEEF